MEVFPTLHLEGDCKVYMEDVRVDRVVTTRARDLLKVYISCDNIIEKEYIYKVEKELHKQLFSALEGGKEGPEVKLYETFHLSAQYDAPAVFGAYKNSMLLELKAMGVDKAVLVSAREFGGSDTFATSQILAAAIKNLGVDKDDIIFCGRQAIDGDTAQVGPQIAEKLEIPQVSYVADIEKDGDTLTVRRMLEDGYMTVQVQTPCLLTCIKELNTPRYMTIRGILDCDAEPVTVLDYNALKDDPLIEVDTIGLKGSPTNIYKSFTPPRKGSGMMLEGSGRETVERLFGILSAKHII